jgi:hypothetical protein
VLEASASQQFLASRRTDQQRALAKLREDPALRCCLQPTTQALPVLPGACRMVEHASVDTCNNDAVDLPCSSISACCRELEVTEAPLVDLEVRGVPALQFFGDTVWK